VRDEFVRHQVRRSMLLTACGLAVSGTGLAVGALGASVIFKRDSAASYAFIATTVLVMAYGLGRVVSPSLTRALAALPIPHAPEKPCREQMGHAQPVREGQP
jgi:sulfite exporter TauE/SafE